MCGLAGVAYQRRREISMAMLGRMGAALRHRGPDGYGFLTSAQIGLVHVRLSIRDIERGAQPLGNEDGSIVVVFNGEIYNDGELRAQLTRRGHRFRTHSDTEVLVHAYEQWGTAMLPRLNGQFAFVIHDRRANTLLLARDRFGIHPLFYALRGGDLYFGSEAKALFASGEIPKAIDPEGLDEVFTFWAARAPRTPFLGIRALEPGTFATWQRGDFAIKRWHRFDYSEAAAEPADAVESLDDLMTSAVSLRMQADVPVGAYLSGGLDSSVVTAVAAKRSGQTLRTFSIGFDQPEFDESAFQHAVAQQVGSQHASERIDGAAIARVFPAVVRHAETPMLRTAPAPLFLLSKLARQKQIKVVLTGEGADEVFLGYDLFKETALRQFCARGGGPAWRKALFKRLYPYLTGGRGGALWAEFFLSAGSADDPLCSHMPRIQLASWIKQFYSQDMRDALQGFDAAEQLRQSLPAGFSRWSRINRAAYLETSTLLSSYLLSTQGDRMLTAHGVEGRYPFLDHRVSEFAGQLPGTSKRRGLHDKLILRRWARSLLPPQLASRPKLPYRAPGIPVFLGDSQPGYVADMLGPDSLGKAGVFEPRPVQALVDRCRAGRAMSIREDQALVGIVSTQLWHQQFIARQESFKPLNPKGADVVWNEQRGNPIAIEGAACYGAA
jgi:asparagine synthase (glutamine-hydrolysing)